MRITHAAQARITMKQGKTALEAGKLEEALDLYRLARSHANESHDQDAPRLRKLCGLAVAHIERELGIAPAPVPAPTLAKTEPDVSDLQAVFGITERRANEKLIEAVDIENTRKAGTHG